MALKLTSRLHGYIHKVALLLTLPLLFYTLPLVPWFAYLLLLSRLSYLLVCRLGRVSVVSVASVRGAVVVRRRV